MAKRHMLAQCEARSSQCGAARHQAHCKPRCDGGEAAGTTTEIFTEPEVPLSICCYSTTD